MRKYGTWINVKEEIPKIGERVLMCGAKGGIYIGKRTIESKDDKAQADSNGRWRIFAYWMPLPEPPEDELSVRKMR